MTTGARAAIPAAPEPAGGRTSPKLDLWICWWVFPVFYALFGLIFVVLTRVMPPPRGTCAASPGRSPCPTNASSCSRTL